MTIFLFNLLPWFESLIAESISPEAMNFLYNSSLSGIRKHGNYISTFCRQIKVLKLGEFVTSLEIKGGMSSPFGLTRILRWSIPTENRTSLI